MKKAKLIILFFASIFTSKAQSIQTPAPSPSATFTQVVGNTEIKMEYSRPGVKERKIFGTGGDYLLQYDEIWRTGANAATQISFSADVKVNGMDVPAGTYAIYTVPGENEWKFILYKDLSVGGNTANYKAEDELVSFMLKPQKLTNNIESLTFGINNITSSAATLDMMWENTHISIPIDANADAQIMAQIESAMANPLSGAASLYRNSANYYYGNDKDLNKALEWISKAAEISNSIFDYETQANIQAALGKYKEAIATISELHKAAASTSGGTLNFYNSTLKPRVDANVAEWKKK